MPIGSAPRYSLALTFYLFRPFQFFRFPNPPLYDCSRPCQNHTAFHCPSSNRSYLTFSLLNHLSLQDSSLAHYLTG